MTVGSGKECRVNVRNIGARSSKGGGWSGGGVGNDIGVAVANKREWKQWYSYIRGGASGEYTARGPSYNTPSPPVYIVRVCVCVFIRRFPWLL